MTPEGQKRIKSMSDFVVLSNLAYELQRVLDHIIQSLETNSLKSWECESKKDPILSLKEFANVDKLGEIKPLLYSLPTKAFGTAEVKELLVFEKKEKMETVWRLFCKQMNYDEHTWWNRITGSIDNTPAPIKDLYLWLENCHREYIETMLKLLDEMTKK